MFLQRKLEHHSVRRTVISDDTEMFSVFEFFLKLLCRENHALFYEQLV